MLVASHVWHVEVNPSGRSHTEVIGMYVPCWKCGDDVWIVNQLECRSCRAPIRRCADCVNLNAQTLQCRALGIDITKDDSLQPTRLSPSFGCQRYQLSGRAAAERRKQKEAAQGEAPATAAPAPKPPPQPRQDQQKAPRRRAQPIIIAHRGGCALGPENTLAAVRAALAAGAQAIEVDVHITKDGHAVAIHDSTLQRTTTGSGEVAAHTLAELKQLDAGAWFGAAHSGERIPTLAEVLAAVPAPTWVNIHLRAHENPTDRCERAVCEAIQAVGLEARTWVTHHTRHGLHRIRQLLPKLRLCWTSPGGESDLEYVDDSYYMGYRMLQPPIHAVSKEFVEYAHERGMWVNVSFARTDDDMRRLIELRVDGIFADDPSRLRALIAKMAQR